MLYSDEEHDSPFQFKTWTPDITSKDARSSKIQRLRLSAQNSLFNFGRGNAQADVLSKQPEKEEVSAETADSLVAHRRISSADITKASETRKFAKKTALAKNLIFEAVKEDAGLALVNFEKKETAETLQNSTSFKSSNDSQVSRGNHEPSIKENCLNISGNSESSVESDEFDEEEEINFETKKNGEQRHSIFLGNPVDEVEEMKEELQVENGQDIYFIQGNFSAYYEELEILGEGASGTVKRCIKNGTSEVFAVKIVRYRGDTERLSSDVKEFKHHKKLNHKNIIKAYELYIDYFTKKTYLIMELVEGQEMFDAIESFGRYSETVASKIFKQILSGINYLHLNGVCHRDLKPNNIMVSKNGDIVKITDFNVSKFSDQKSEDYTAASTQNYKMWTHTGTIAFTAPEVFSDSQYTEAVDMWSAGVVLYTMLCGYQPFQADNVNDLIEKIKEANIDLTSEAWNGVSQQAKDLIKCLLTVDFKARYSPFQALIHPWIANEARRASINLSGVFDNVWSYLNGSPSKSSFESQKSLAYLESQTHLDGLEKSPNKNHEKTKDIKIELDYDNKKKTNLSNLINMAKLTASSTYIEGKCLSKASMTKEDEVKPKLLERKLTHFNTYEELPVILSSSKEEIGQSNVRHTDESDDKSNVSSEGDEL